VLIAAGIIGVVTGAVPLTINTVRVVANERAYGMVDLAAHGVEAMGLSREWGMLSSGMGTLLGVLLLCAGAAWLTGKATAPLLSWVYVAAGLTVNAIDMLIFIFRAKPGFMRSEMLLFDSLAAALPVALAAWLILRNL
jgi:hypothetical protein